MMDCVILHGDNHCYLQASLLCITSMADFNLCLFSMFSKDCGAFQWLFADNSGETTQCRHLQVCWPRAERETSCLRGNLAAGRYELSGVAPLILCIELEGSWF